MQKNDRPPGFTLVELIIVMALLALVTAFAVPSLSRSMRQRNISDEAARLLALTEYARSEAESQGVPMTVWLEPKGQRFGVQPKPGFEGDEAREKEFELNPDIHFEVELAATRDGVADAVEFSPAGAPASTSIASIQLVDRFGATVKLARTTDKWGYEVAKEKQ